MRNPVFLPRFPSNFVSGGDQFDLKVFELEESHQQCREMTETFKKFGAEMRKVGAGCGAQILEVWIRNVEF